MSNAPCKDCSERKVGCHSQCEKYKLYADELHEISEKEKKDKSWLGYWSQRKNKMAKEQNRHKRR